MRAGFIVRARRAILSRQRPLKLIVRAHVKTKNLTNAMGALFLAALLTMIGTRQYYTWHMPISATEARVIPVSVNYGRTVFVTDLERDLLYGTYIWCASMVVVLIILRSNQRLERP